MQRSNPTASTPSDWPLLTLTSPDGLSTANVCLNGGQVLSWRMRGREQLFLSRRACFSPTQAIRGGVPVIFPQFGTRGDGPRHGFARLRRWEIAKTDGSGSLTVALRGGPEPDWPYPFELRLQTALWNDRLVLGLAIQNLGTTPFTFTAALHTYLRVDDIADASLHGLADCPYLDATAGSNCKVQRATTLEFPDEVDRIYPGAPSSLRIIDGDRQLMVRQHGFRDTVVWNPGPVMTANLSDLTPSDHRRFLCVEAGVIECPARLSPGETWHGSQVLIG